MRLPADILYTVSVIAAAIGYRRTGAKLLAVLAAVAVGLLLLDIARFRTVHVQVDVLDVILIAIAIGVVVHVQGLPYPVARRVGIGWRSREWEFDRGLHICREQLDKVLLAHPSSADWAVYRRWQTDALRTGLRVVKKMESLSPPDDAWAHLRDDYVDLYKQILSLLANDEPPDDEYTTIRGTELRRRADALRLRYREAARAARGID
jgi:hypothetical protein